MKIEILVEMSAILYKKICNINCPRKSCRFIKKTCEVFFFFFFTSFVDVLPLVWKFYLGDFPTTDITNEVLTKKGRW